MGFTVWCTARDETRAQAAAEQWPIRPASRHSPRDRTASTCSSTNAAIDYDTDARALSADLDRVRTDLETNVLGAWRVAQAFAALLRASPHGLLDDDGPTGGFFRDGRPLPW